MIPKLGGQSIFNAPYKVTVTFDSITIHNDHDNSINPFSDDTGNGEWDMAAYVQGKAVDLLTASGGGLNNANEGQTIDFTTDNAVTVDIPKIRPLSIFTLGAESDCGTFSFGAQLLPLDWPDIQQVVPILDEPESLFHNWYSSISSIQAGLYKDVTEVWNHGGKCTWDVLGFVNKIYMPPGHSYEPIGYGAGAHTNVVSSNGDFTLRYTISVTEPPAVPVVNNAHNGPIIQPGGNTTGPLNNTNAHNGPITPPSRPPSNTSAPPTLNGTAGNPTLKGTTGLHNLPVSKAGGSTGDNNITILLAHNKESSSTLKLPGSSGGGNEQNGGTVSTGNSSGNINNNPSIGGSNSGDSDK